MNHSTVPHNPRVLEFFCGIGGFAVALAGQGHIAAAVDINQTALRVYRHNFQHQKTVVATKTIESIPLERFSAWQADLWWMSPPCQPYTRRGKQLDLADPRAAAFSVLLQRIDQLRPPYLAMENVTAFQHSQAHCRLLEVLQRGGYSYLENVWCSTQFGLPNRRPRYYLVAARQGTPRWCAPAVESRPLHEYLEIEPPEDLFVDGALLSRYRAAVHLVDSCDPRAVTTCFTSAYGRSPVHSGSYLSTPAGVRRFSPREILRLLGFPESYNLPSSLRLSQAYRLVGNSLSIPVVRHVLRAVKSC